MTRVVFRGGQALIGRGFSRRDVVAHDGVIVGEAVETVSGDEGSDRDLVIDATDLVIAPGFVDLQINGAFGLDLSSDPSSMWDLAALLPRLGVTSFLPTIITAPPARYHEAIEALAAPPATLRARATPIGLHFEGPMLNPLRVGAHPIEHLRLPHLDLIDGWNRARGVTLVTLAPELAGAYEVVAELRRRGVVVSAGHTDADSAEAGAAFGAGISLVTHLFNAMAPFGHRAPSLVGAALTNPDVTVGVIVDGVHVDPVAVDLVWRAKGPDGLLLVTDAVAPMALDQAAASEPTLGAHSVRSDGTSVRRLDGTLAGSLLAMGEAVRNLVAFTGCSVSAALRCASTIPADVIGDRTRGRISRGAIADLVVLNDALEVQMTFCAGVPVYIAESAAGRLNRPVCTSE
ncbi:MAG: N-acetylglucosamine-6-phosphate deacetylase [Actinomycetota bacterium]|nr:N-acetylglucosamine-6-phosphate deacetylase [Actinomycetota bacterium]